MSTGTEQLEAAGALPSAFVTYGWCRTAYTVVRSLAAHGVDVHVGDASPLAMSRYSRYARSFTRLPDFFSAPSAYIDEVAKALERTGAGVLLPCHEDVRTVILNRHRLPAGVRIAVPSLDDWSMAEDKLDYVNRVQSAGCPVPDTYSVFSHEELSDLKQKLTFPVLVKPRIGNSAKGIRIVATASGLEPAFYDVVREYKLAPSRWPIVQQFLHGPKLGTLGIYNRGKHVSSVVFRIVRSKGASNFGTSTYRIAIDDPETKTNAIRAMESLNWHGVVDMDWVRDERGTACLIDINGRLGGATALSCLSGMDMPWLWYQIALGQRDIAASEPRAGTQARWILGDTLGLLDSLFKGRFKELRAAALSPWWCGCDDLVWNDPLPFIFQCTDYLWKFVKARGNINPITEGMIQ